MAQLMPTYPAHLYPAQGEPDLALCILGVVTAFIIFFAMHHRNGR